ncbi:hypothetical protein AVEN_205625-1 [Araneus ventricosus]|uniref:Uncharacterized protein n=1 Tax=Araneus ventricosus TaxID=182803 RepID=A0A4Y2II01_ARAVE|nr:hypothetical protein AVEN_205625-1 [Araneus ventricosus]
MTQIISVLIYCRFPPDNSSIIWSIWQVWTSFRVYNCSPSEMSAYVQEGQTSRRIDYVLIPLGRRHATQSLCHKSILQLVGKMETTSPAMRDDSKLQVMRHCFSSFRHLEDG